jgi:hypothetical protein
MCARAASVLARAALSTLYCRSLRLVTPTPAEPCQTVIRSETTRVYVYVYVYGSGEVHLEARLRLQMFSITFFAGMLYICSVFEHLHAQCFI